MRRQRLLVPRAIRRLDEIEIHLKDGFIVVTDEPDLDTYALPVSSPWIVRCGVGASIQLGAVASGSEGFVGSQVDVELFNNGLIDKSACAVVVPRLAARLQERLAGK